MSEQSYPVGCAVQRAQQVKHHKEVRSCKHVAKAKHPAEASSQPNKNPEEGLQVHGHEGVAAQHRRQLLRYREVQGGQGLPQASDVDNSRGWFVSAYTVVLFALEKCARGLFFGVSASEEPPWKVRFFPVPT